MELSTMVYSQGIGNIFVTLKTFFQIFLFSSLSSNPKIQVQQLSTQIVIYLQFHMHGFFSCIIFVTLPSNLSHYQPKSNFYHCLPVWGREKACGRPLWLFIWETTLFFYNEVETSNLELIFQTSLSPRRKPGAKN